MADLSISVVSYRTPELLRACLEALATERAGSALAIEVTVVDNASGDESAALVRTAFPWVRLIENGTNVGFGAAHNQALLGSTARYLLALNSDTTVAPGALGALVTYLDAHPGVAIAGPLLRRPDGSVQPSRR